MTSTRPVIYAYTANMAEADGQLFRIPKQFTDHIGLPTMRVSIGTWDWIDWKDEVGRTPAMFDDPYKAWQDGILFDTGSAEPSQFVKRFGRLLRVAAKAARRMGRDRDDFTSFEIQCKSRGRTWKEKFFLMVDTTSGERCLHICLPEEY